MIVESAVVQLARRFQTLTLSREEWTHRAHLAVGLWHVANFGPAEALERLRIGIRALNERNGVANTATGGYHETITRAYVLLLESFLARRRSSDSGDDCDLQNHFDALIHDPLIERTALLAHWTRERLHSSQARAEWLEPDLAPLTIATPVRPVR